MLPCLQKEPALLYEDPSDIDVGRHPNTLVQSSLIKAYAFSCNR